MNLADLDDLHPIVLLNAGSEAETIVVCNAILNSEMMTDEQTEAMVDQLASHLKKESAGLGS